MSRFRVLFVSNRAEVVGGGEVSLLLLLEGLIEAGRVEPVLSVPAPGEVADRAARLGVRCIEFPLPGLRRAPWRWPALRRAARRLLAETDPRLVHVNGTRAMLVLGGLPRSIPVVWHVRVEGRDVLDPLLVRRASAVIVPSRTVGARFPGAVATVVPNPVRLPAPADPERIRRLRGDLAPQGEMLLLAVGELTPRKNPLGLLEALATLPGGTDWRLLLVGRPDPGHPDLPERIRDLASRLGLSDRVDLLGFREDVPDLMTAADLLVHVPTSEGFGRVFIEAMACGLPLVATPVGGLAELHRETGYGRLTTGSGPREVGAAVAAALADREGRSRARHEGPALVRERYSVAAHTAGVTAVYEQLLEEGR